MSDPNILVENTRPIAYLLILLGISIATSAQTQSETSLIIRGPYLQKATSSSMIIRWRTIEPSISTINYGLSANNLDQSMADNKMKTEHELEITDLNPNTVYYYEIENAQSDNVNLHKNLYFKTYPTIGTETPLRAWILGDCGTANQNQRKVRDAYYGYTANNEHTDMILFLGDNAYNDGTDKQYQKAIFENMYEEKLKNTVAWSCLGNHDGHSAESDSQTGPYYDIFSFPKLGESGGVASGTEAYYSFDYGNIHFIVLESYETDKSVDGAMYNWCENDIQNTTAEWIVALWHHPPYTKGSHNSDRESALIKMRLYFLPLLEANGVDLVLSGHSHSYERSHLINGHYGKANTFDPATHIVNNGAGNGKIDQDGAYLKDITGPNEDKGAVYITTGSSGKVSGGSLDHPAMYYSVSELGSCLLEIEGNQMDIKFIRENGIVEDYFSIQKTQSNDLPTITPTTTTPTPKKKCFLKNLFNKKSDK